MDLLNRLEFGSAQQAATPQQATDQSLESLDNEQFVDASSRFASDSDLSHPVLEGLTAVQMRDLQAQRQHYVDLLHKERCRLAKLEQIKEETVSLIQAITHRTDLPEGITTSEGLVSPYEAKSSDYVRLSHLTPLKWYEGLDCAPVPSRSFARDDSASVPVNNGNHQVNHPVKRREGNSTFKAHAIAGYLRRKALKVGKSPVSRQTLSKPQQQSQREAGETVNNRFASLQDEAAEVDGTPCHMDAEEATAEVSGGEATLVEGSTHGSSRRSSNCEVTVRNYGGKLSIVAGNDFEDLPLPSFSKARALRDKKSRKTFTALTYYLKCKHYMHMKDPHFIRTLVQDARAWLIRGQYKMESYRDYVILTSAVMSAFFVDQEELAFRARMKNATEWQAMSKHNNACNGDLGYRFGGVEARFKNLRHVFQTHVTLPPSSISA